MLVDFVIKMYAKVNGPTDESTKYINDGMVKSFVTICPFELIRSLMKKKAKKYVVNMNNVENSIENRP